MKTKKTKKISEYGRQLKEKQELKKIYGLREHTLRNYVEKAQSMEGNPENNVIILLESRLDSTIYRMGFAKTQRQARQQVTHGLFTLNNRRVDIPSIQVKIGDVVAPRRKEQFDDQFIQSKVSWLVVESDFVARVVAKPNLEEVALPLDLSLALQFYSR